MDIRHGTLSSFLDPDPARPTRREGRADEVKTPRTEKYPLVDRGWQTPAPGSATRLVNAQGRDTHMQANGMLGLTDPTHGGACVAFHLRQIRLRTARGRGGAFRHDDRCFRRPSTRRMAHLNSPSKVFRLQQPSRTSILPPRRSTRVLHGAFPPMLANVAGEAARSRLQPPVEEGQTWA